MVLQSYAGALTPGARHDPGCADSRYAGWQSGTVLRTEGIAAERDDCYPCRTKGCTEPAIRHMVHPQSELRGSVIRNVSAMKTNLLDALLASPGGEAIRKAFSSPEDLALPEIVYLRLRRGSERSGECSMRIVLAKIGQDGCLSGEAADVDFRCVGVHELRWSFEWDPHGIEADLGSDRMAGPTCPLEIDTQDRFRICCERIEVLNVRPYHLDKEEST